MTEPRPDLFMHTVNQLNYGATALELSDQLAECVKEASITGKNSKLTLTLTIKPVGATGQYQITDDVKATLPKQERGMTLLFGTPDGNLQRENPRQSALPLRSVDDEKPAQYKTAEK